MRTVRVRFLCLGMGAIGAFHNDEENEVYVYSHEMWNWLPLPACRTLLVQMYDFCPHPRLQEHQYRLWNEHILQKALRRVSGEGILSIVHRDGWSWHYGLTWSREPLVPKSGNITSDAPRWWHAEDLWCEGPESFEQMADSIEEMAYAHDVQWARMSAIHHETMEQARGVLGEDADPHAVANFARELRGEDPIPRPPLSDPNEPTFEQRIQWALADVIARTPLPGG